jgi:ribonuclease BN (tRNA processing enzyme)
MSDRVIVFTGDTGPSDAVTELAKGADLLVTEAASFEDRMQRMIDNGRWQAMTPAEQARVTGQATRDITLEDNREDGGTRQRQDSCAVAP